MPFDSRQFALNEMGDEHIREDSWAVQSVTGASGYLRGVDYSQEKFREELKAMVEHIKRKQTITNTVDLSGKER